MSVNMSYCKFENTSMALRECMNEIEARLENPGSVDVGYGVGQEEYDDEPRDGLMSDYEANGLKAILSMALDIIEASGGRDELYEAIESM